jgi:hypothetical protein
MSIGQQLATLHEPTPASAAIKKVCCGWARRAEKTGPLYICHGFFCDWYHHLVERWNLPGRSRHHESAPTPSCMTGLAAWSRSRESNAANLKWSITFRRFLPESKISEVVSRSTLFPTPISLPCREVFYLEVIKRRSCWR